MKKILVLLLFFTTPFFAQTVDSLFLSANTFYKNANYTKAIDNYKKIIATEQTSAELYYNLGNAYYKLNKVGPTVFYYEKALALDPTNADVKNNLVFAKRLALDNIEMVPKTILEKLNSKYLQQLSYNQWAIVAVSLSFISVGLFLLFYFSVTSFKRRVFFTLTSISIILFISSILVTYNQYNFKINNKTAIVFAEETQVNNAPTLNADVVFTLHEGTKVTVLDAVDNWSKIKIADGKQGWIISDEIQLLNP